jgi:hypothetical protein
MWPEQYWGHIFSEYFGVPGNHSFHQLLKIIIITSSRAGTTFRQMFSLLVDLAPLSQTQIFLYENF